MYIFTLTKKVEDTVWTLCPTVSAQWDTVFSNSDGLSQVIDFLFCKLFFKQFQKNLNKNCFQRL